MGAGVKIRHTKKRAVLKRYERCGNVVESVKAAGVSRQLHYKWLESDAVYSQAFVDSQAVYLARLESEADRRAMGWTETVYDRQGQAVGERFKYSDLMMTFRLKGLAPDRYAERRQVDQRVSVQVSPFQELKPSERARELERLQSVLSEVGGGGGVSVERSIASGGGGLLPSPASCVVEKKSESVLDIVPEKNTAEKKSSIL